MGAYGSNKSQMRCLALFLGTKNIPKHQTKNHIYHRLYTPSEALKYPKLLNKGTVIGCGFARWYLSPSRIG